MPSVSEWKVPSAAQPKPNAYGYDLDRALSAVVGVRANVPDDAFTAEILGTERVGNGVLIRPGVVLTIGYLITEAETIWLSLFDGRLVPGHALAYDQSSGFGLIQPLARVDVPALELGTSADAAVGTSVVIGGAGGRPYSLAASIVAKQEFAGYWEYLLDEAIFTSPSHPHWGGTAVIGPDGKLIGIGSLQLEQARSKGGPSNLNMIVPIDLLKPVFEDLMTTGRPKGPARPWLGLYATEFEERVIVAGLATKGPAEQAGLKAGDIVRAVAGMPARDLAGFYRRVWKLGPAGVEVPLSVRRDDSALELTITSTDRNRLLKAPRVH